MIHKWSLTSCRYIFLFICFDKGNYSKSTGGEVISCCMLWNRPLNCQKMHLVSAQVLLNSFSSPSFAFEQIQVPFFKCQWGIIPCYCATDYCLLFLGFLLFKLLTCSKELAGYHGVLSELGFLQKVVTKLMYNMQASWDASASLFKRYLCTVYLWMSYTHTAFVEQFTFCVLYH